MRLFLTRHRRVNTVSSMRDDRVATNRGKLVLLEREGGRRFRYTRCISLRAARISHALFKDRGGWPPLEALHKR